MPSRKSPTRARNPQARAEYVDPLTGQRVPATTPAAIRSGRKIVRVRPRSGEAFEVVTVDDDDLDPRRDTFGIDPSATGRYRQIAGLEADERRHGKPLLRDADLNLGKIGASTTFPSAKRAVEIFIENNAHFFDDPSFEDVDAYDATLEFMDSIEVRSGNRHVRLSKTHRGEQILRSGAHSGAAIVRAMLAYLFGQAGSYRRWRDVPWASVDAYLGQIRAVMADDAARRGAHGPSSAAFWYPLASGVYDTDTMLSLAVEDLGEAKAAKLADWMNSQYLFDLAERLEHVLHPRKGVPGRSGRRARKCLGKEARKTVAARRRQILAWAAYPESVPMWACVATAATETSAAGICLFPGLEEEVRRVEAACDVPYDPAWPAAERARRCSQGQIDAIDQFGSGVAPLGCGDMGEHVNEIEPIEPLPWESNPSDEEFYLVPVGASDNLIALQRTLEQHGWEIDDIDIDMHRQIARIQLRRFKVGEDPLLVTFDARNGKATTTRERIRTKTVPVGRKGDRFLAKRLETEFIGRQKHDGLRSGLRWFSNYIADNAPIPMTGAEVRGVLGPVMSESERESNPGGRSPSKQQLDAAVKAMQLYLGSVDFASLKDQQRLHGRVSRAVSKVATSAGIDDIAAWEQIEKEARRRGIIRLVPGKHMNPRKAPEVWSCPSGPAEYVDVYKEFGEDVDEDEIFAAADLYSVFPEDVRDDWHVRYGSISLPSGPIWVVRHSGIEYFFTNNASWHEEMDDLVAKIYPEENPGRRRNPSARARRIGSRISNP